MVTSPWPSWLLPNDPWVLHSTALLGNLTERWIETQAQPSPRYDARVLGLRPVAADDLRAHWLVATDSPVSYLSYRGMYKSGGLSMRMLRSVFATDPPAAVHAHYGTAAAQHRQFARALDVPLVASFYGYDATMSRYTDSRLWRARFK